MWLFNQNISRFCERRGLKTSPRLYTTWNTIIRSRVLLVVKPSISIKIWHCEKFHFIMRLKDERVFAGDVHRRCIPQRYSVNVASAQDRLEPQRGWVAFQQLLPLLVLATSTSAGSTEIGYGIDTLIDHFSIIGSLQCVGIIGCVSISA